MNRIITGIILILLAISGKAQESCIVHGYLEGPGTRPSVNFQKNMFCYLKGSYVMPAYNSLCTFKVDSVVSGSFQSLNNEVNNPPFNIMIAIMNECTVLDYRQIYTLRIKQFPNTNYYYIDSLNQVLPNDKYPDRQARYHHEYQQNIAILTKGTLQQRHDLLDKIQQYNYTSQYTDYRYISYILPFMTSKDTITNYGTFFWDGIDKDGNHIGGSEIVEEKGSYADFLYDYLDKLCPFALPDKTMDSMGWQDWYKNLFREKKCFSPVKYVQSEQKTIINKKIKTLYIAYFISDTLTRKIYFASNQKAYTLNINADELIEIPLPGNCQYPSINHFNYSIQNNEIPEYNSFFKSIILSELDNGVFCRQDKKAIPLNLQYNETASSSYTYPHLITHQGNDFFIFSSQNPKGYNCLKAGKIDRKGKWIIQPENLYTKSLESYAGNVDDIGTFSFCQSAENEITFAFSDRSYGRKSYSANEKYSSAILVYKLNANLEVKDSVVLTLDFPRFDYSLYGTQLLKKDDTYLLIARTRNNNYSQLYYRLLNDDLTPKTAFIKLADNKDYYPTEKPIVISEGFMLSWVDNDLSENVLRSVIIDKSGKQSKTINVTNKRTKDIYNIEFDKDSVDIYLLITDEETLVRKRIAKKEYGL